MDKIGSKFVWSEETEVERLIHTAKQVWSGFYANKGFVILPELFEREVASVCLPDWEYSLVPEWRENLRKIELNFPIKAKKEFKDRIKVLLEGKIEIDNYLLQGINHEWKNIETEFWRRVGDFMPEVVGLIGNVEIRLTSIGTISSYQYLTKEPKQNCIIYLRKDGNTTNIAEAILTSLICTQVEESGWTWEEVESMVDFLLTRSKLNKIFPKFPETLKAIRNRDLEKDRLSRIFLEKLGVGQEKKLRVRYGEIYLYGDRVDGKLSKSQKKILKAMLRSENGFVSLLEIERVLWGNQFGGGGVWAVNKSVQRLRKQLIALGTDRFIIQTVRGQGYRLDS